MIQIIKNKISNIRSAVPYLVAWKLIGLAPAASVERVFNKLADRMASDERRLKYLRINLATVLGIEPAEVTYQDLSASMRSYFRYWREVFQLSYLDKDAVVNDIEFVNKEPLLAALQAEEGLLIVLPHSGNWDVAGLWLARMCGHFYTVNERLKPEIIYKKFVAYRESLGFRIYADDSRPYTKLRANLLAKEAVCLLVDRPVRKRANNTSAGEENSAEVLFFNKNIHVTLGPARLAKETGVPLLPVYPTFTEKGWKIVVHDLIDTSGDVVAISQQIMHAFEGFIQADPINWHAMVRIWDPPREHDNVH